MTETRAERHTNEAHNAILDVHNLGNGLTVHRYRRCGFSGAGNCCCGRAEHSTLHPHPFSRALVKNWLCVCGKPERHEIHEIPEEPSHD